MFVVVSVRLLRRCYCPSLFRPMLAPLLLLVLLLLHTTAFTRHNLHLSRFICGFWQEIRSNHAEIAALRQSLEGKDDKIQILNDRNQVRDSSEEISAYIAVASKFLTFSPDPYSAATARRSFLRLVPRTSGG